MWQILALLLRRAMPQQRAHDVHLCVASPGVGTRTIGLLKNDRGFGQASAAAAVLLRDQSRQSASVVQSLYKGFGIAARLFDAMPILAVKRSTYVAHALANISML